MYVVWYIVTIVLVHYPSILVLVALVGGGGKGAWMRVQVRRFKFPYAFAYIFRFRGAQNHTVTNAKLRELSRKVYDN